MNGATAMMHCTICCDAAIGPPPNYLPPSGVLNMSLQTVVDDVKGRVETLTAQGQKVAQISFDTLKPTGEITADKFQALVKTQSEAAKEIYSAAKAGFDKAVADGF